ncbi:MAG: hypothetical protein K2M31_04885 [Muribaculaceae bacterium]|nr:hypothetical protein [Muribaculaceae bacterium]
MNSIKTGAILSALLFSSFTAAMAVEYKTVMPLSTDPSEGQEIASSVGVDEITVTMPGGGVFGIEKILRNKLIGIERDGEFYKNVSSADVSKVKFSNKSTSDFVICPGLINLPGTYTITLPEHLVEMAIELDPTLGEGEVPPVSINASYSFSFTIVDFPEYDISPKPGLYQPSDLETFTLSFPEGAVAGAGSSSVPVALYVYDFYKNDLTRQTTYSLEPQGNKLVMKANDPASIKALTYGLGRQWYYLEIPKNAVNVTLDGKVMSNPALKFSKYDVRTVGEDGFSISPSPAENLIPSDLCEFTLSYPARYSLDTTGAGKIKSTGAFLTQTGTAEADKLNYDGYYFGTLVITAIDEEKRTITMQMAKPQSPLSYENNPDMMETGYYCVSLSPRVLKGKEVLNFPGYGVKGRDKCSLANLRVIVNGEATDSLTLQRGQSFSGIELFYPFRMKVKDRSKAITLTLNGSTLASIPISSLNIPTNGDKYMMVNFFKVFKTPGEYTVTIPGDVFEQTAFGNYLNMDQNVKIIIPGATTEVEGIEIEDESDPVYYTLDGRRVNAGHLEPGIYVRLHKGRAEKIKI